MSGQLAAPLGSPDLDPILLEARTGFREVLSPEVLFAAHDEAVSEIDKLVEKHAVDPVSNFRRVFTLPLDYIDADGRPSSVYFIRDENEGYIQLIAYVRDRQSRLREHVVFDIPAVNSRPNGRSVIHNANKQIATLEETNWLRIIVRRMGEVYRAASTD